MGESYRGLTIKLGADTTSLQKALKTVNQAAQATQTELRRIQKALNIDPSNLTLSALKLDALGDNAQEARGKLRRLSQAANQFDDTGIRQLAEDTRSVAVRAARARESYTQVNSAIAKVNAELKEFRELQKSGEALTDEQKERVRELKSEYQRLSSVSGEYAATLKQLNSAERFKSLKTEIAATAAEVRDAARQMAELAVESGRVGKNTAGVKRLRSQLEGIDATAEELRGEFKKLDAALEVDPGNLELAAKRAANLEEQAQLATKRVQALESAMDKLKSSGIEDAGKSMEELREDTRRAKTEYTNLEGAVASAAARVDELEAAQRDVQVKKGMTEEYDQLGTKVKEATERLKQLKERAEQASKALDTANAREQLRKLSTEADEARTSLKKLQTQQEATSGTKSGSITGSTVRSVGNAMQNVGVYATLAGSKVIDSAETIDSAYRDMKKTVEGTDEQFEQLRADAIEFSKTHITSADTILEIEAMGGQLGISIDHLSEFADVASNLDIATDMDAEDIAQTLGQLNNILDWGEGDMERFGDALVRLGNNMPAQESAIVDITDRIGAAANMYGMTTPEILAWSTAVAATGQNSEAAGTAVSNSLSDIENAVASGGDALQGFADVAGMSAEDFAALWNTDASSAFEKFVQGLARIESEGGSADVALNDLGITGVRQKQALKGLSQTLDVLDDSLQMSSDAWRGVDDEWGDAGDAAREAAQKSEGFSGAMGMLRNSAAALGDEVGDALLPFIQTLTGVIQDVTEWFGNLSDGAQTFLIVIAGLTPVAGIALDVAGAFMSLKTSFMKTSSVGQKLTGVIGKLKTATGMGSAGLGFAVMAAVAAIGLIIDVYSKCAEHSEKMTKATEGIRDSIKASADEGEKAAQSGLGGYDKTLEDLREDTDDLIESAADLADALTDSFTETRTNNALLQGYADAVGDLAGRSDLTAEEVALLQIAVDQINESCDTSYTVSRDAAGAYQVMGDNAEVATGKIAGLVEQLKAQAEVDAYKNAYTSIAEQKITTDAQISALEKREAELQEIIDNSPKNMFGAMDEEGQKAALELYQVKQDIAELTEISDGYADTMGEILNGVAELSTVTQDASDVLFGLVANNAQAISGLQESGRSVEDLSQKMSNMGITAEQFSTMSDDMIWSIAHSFDGTEESIASTIIQLDEHFSNLGDDTQWYMEHLASCFDVNGNGIAENLAAFAEDLRGAGLNSAADYIETFAAQLSANAGEATAAAEEVSDATTEAMDAAEEAAEEGTEAGEEYSEGVEGESDDAYESGSEVSDAAEQGLAEADNSYQLGTNFAQGYANGISDHGSLAYNAGYAIAQQANAGTAAGQQSASPSKKARKLGNYFSQGYELGIGDLAGDAVRRARSMATDTLAAVRKSYAGYDFAGAAESAAYGYNRAQAAFQGRYYGLSKADAYDAFDSAIRSNSGGEVAVYVDGKKLASTIAGDMDARLGVLGTRRGR